MIQLSSGDLSPVEAILRKGLARTPNSGKLLWGMGILSVVQGRNDSAEEHLKKCADLIPEWAVSHAVLGIYYYATGQIAKVSETLNRYMELSPQGELNVQRIQEILAGTSLSEAQSSDPNPSLLNPAVNSCSLLWLFWSKKVEITGRDAERRSYRNSHMSKLSFSLSE